MCGRSSERGARVAGPSEWLHPVTLSAGLCRESEYTTFHELRVLAGTFNANGKKPQGDVRGWIKTQDGAEPDIVVLRCGPRAPPSASGGVSHCPHPIAASRRLWI